MLTNLHRYYSAGYLHFITTSCYQRRPLLGTPQNRDLFLEVLEEVRRRHHFTIVGYVEKLPYMHRNPVVRGLVIEPEQWNGSSYRH